MSGGFQMECYCDRGKVPHRYYKPWCRAHERETVKVALAESWWCLRGLLYHLTAPLRALPLCRIGVHDWCRCCSPVICTRCRRLGHD